MITRIDPPIWLNTPKGLGLAHFVIDRGIETELEWVVFHQNGEIWCVENPEVRAVNNWTAGRGRKGESDE